MKHFYSLMALAAIISLSSCNHKDLWYDQTAGSNVTVVFDWRNAPDADPASMELYLYDASGSTFHPLHYVFTGRDGGPASISFGSYQALGKNSDDNSWAVRSGSDDIDSFEISTLDASTLSAYGLSSYEVPRADAAAGERMAATPSMSWSARVDDVYLPVDTAAHVITLYPEEIVCHYTVDILDVENIASVHGEEIDGTLSGMAESYNCGRCCTSGATVTHPFVLTADAATGSLHSEFLTFGVHSDDVAVPHILTIYLYLSDGSKWSYDFDVASQISSAPDPRHVHIVVRGLSLPEATPSAGGFRPNVEDWNSEHIDLEM